MRWSVDSLVQTVCRTLDVPELARRTAAAVRGLAGTAVSGPAFEAQVARAVEDALMATVRATIVQGDIVRRASALSAEQAADEIVAELRATQRV